MFCTVKGPHLLHWSSTLLTGYKTKVLHGAQGQGFNQSKSAFSTVNYASQGQWPGSSILYINCERPTAEFLNLNGIFGTHYFIFDLKSKADSVTNAGFSSSDSFIWIFQEAWRGKSIQCFTRQMGNKTEMYSELCIFGATWEFMEQTLFACYSPSVFPLISCHLSSVEIPLKHTPTLSSFFYPINHLMTS